MESYSNSSGRGSSSTHRQDSRPTHQATPVRCHASFQLGPLLQQAFDDEGRSSDHELEDDEPLLASSVPAGPPHPAPAPAQHSTTRSHRKRAAQRAKKFNAEGRQARGSVHDKYVKNSAAITTSLVTEELPAAWGGYTAKIDTPSNAKKEWRVEELVDRGFTLVQWDGRQARPIADAEGRIFAVLAGQPADASYAESCRKACSAILRAGQSTRFRPTEKKHRRGDFPALNVGVTHGKGTLHPVNLKTGTHTEVVEQLLGDADIQRLAAFADASFALWAPDVYAYYQNQLTRLWEEMPNLRKIFRRSIFPSAAFNFGPRVRTFKHRDYLNCPFGWCAVQALGTFDATQGGHLILWEAQLVVEFPAGSLILIPSATVTHSNTPSLPHETRLSFTQYCAGGLFRYVDNGFRTDSELERDDPVKYEEMKALKDSRWQRGLRLFSTLTSIRH